MADFVLPHTLPGVPDGGDRILFDGIAPWTVDVARIEWQGQQAA